MNKTYGQEYKIDITYVCMYMNKCHRYQYLFEILVNCGHKII